MVVIDRVDEPNMMVSISIKFFNLNSKQLPKKSLFER